jgi:hypothetical protein
MMDNTAAPPLGGYRLTDEHRRRVADCLAKDDLSLPPDRFKVMIRDLEASIDAFLSTAHSTSFREAHDALRRLWQLCADDDPPVWMVRRLIRTLPRKAVKDLDGRFPIVISALYLAGDRELEFPGWADFLEWACTADPSLLIFATRVITAQGAQIVAGRSRGEGKRSRPREEPIVMGEARGAGTQSHEGGRPRNTEQGELIMFLALGWHSVTGEAPTPGRSDESGFGDLVHSVFQWLGLPEGSASYALRGYWTEVRKAKGRRSEGNL